MGQETTNYILELENSDLKQIDPFYGKIQNMWNFAFKKLYMI